MRDQPEAGGEQPLALGIDQVVHPDVVLGDVGLALGRRRRDLLVHLRRDALGELLGQPRFGPLAPRPFPSFLQALFQRGHREVQQHDEPGLVGEQVLDQVRAGIIGREDSVDRQQRSHVQVHPVAQLPAHLVEIAAKLLEGVLEVLEALVERGRVGDEVVARECGEGFGRPVVGSPQPGCLLDAALDAGALRFAVLGGQLALQALFQIGRNRASCSLRRRCRLVRHVCLSASQQAGHQN